MTVERAAHGAAAVLRVIEKVRQDPGSPVLAYQDVPWVPGACPAR
ncbi:hypothetical protein [Streptomyces omiyaensis]|nr:hypothetical protein [Streptomyces omiyaensis]